MNQHWDASLATGIPSIDADHYDILERINRITERQSEREHVTEALRFLDYLEGHVLHHFLEEEEQMVSFGYPQMLQHRAEHGKLVDYIVTLRQQISGHRDVDLILVSNRLLCNWMLTHIRTTDHDLAQFLRTARRAVSA